ncbi:hypothetical protein NN561_007939 [Cricetulus griseus]
MWACRVIKLSMPRRGGGARSGRAVRTDVAVPRAAVWVRAWDSSAADAVDVLLSALVCGCVSPVRVPPDRSRGWAGAPGISGLLGVGAVCLQLDGFHRRRECCFPRPVAS